MLFRVLQISYLKGGIAENDLEVVTILIIAGKLTTAN